MGKGTKGFETLKIIKTEFKRPGILKGVWDSHCMNSTSKTHFLERYIHTYSQVQEQSLQHCNSKRNKTEIL